MPWDGEPVQLGLIGAGLDLARYFLESAIPPVEICVNDTMWV